MPDPVYDPETGEIVGYIPTPPKPNTLCVITDAAGIVVDVASRKENLSCGLLVADHKQYDDIEGLADVRVGDTFDGVTLTPDPATRAAEAERRTSEAKVRARQRELAVADLKSKGEIPVDYE